MEDVGDVLGVPFPSFPPSFAPTPSFISAPPPAPPPAPAVLLALRGEKSLLVLLVLGERMEEDEDEGRGEVGTGGGDLVVEVEEEDDEDEEAGMGVGACAVDCELGGERECAGGLSDKGPQNGINLRGDKELSHTNTLYSLKSLPPPLPQTIPVFKYTA